MSRRKKIAETVGNDPEVMALWKVEKNSDDPNEVPLYSKARYHFICPLHGTEFQMCLHVLRRGSTGCYTCQDKPLLCQANPALEEYYSTNNKVPFIRAKASRQKALYICSSCGDEYEAENREMAKLLNAPLCRRVHDSIGEVLDRLQLTLLAEYYSPEETSSLRGRNSTQGLMLYYRCAEGHESRGTARSLRYHSIMEEACCDNRRAMHRLSSMAPQLEEFYAEDNPTPFQDAFCTRGTLFNWSKEYFYKRASYPTMLGKDPWSKSAMTPIQGFNTLDDVYPGIASQLADIGDATRLHCHSQEKAEWQCPNHPEIPYIMMVAERTKRGRGCPYCSNTEILSGYNDAATRCPEQMARLDDAGRELASSVFPSSSVKVIWHCLDQPHHAPYEKTFKEALINGHQCPTCVQAGSSAMEKEFGDALEKLSGMSLERNNRSVLGGRRELDLYSAELRAAIEFNGEYWHSSERAKQVDAWKVERCKELAISLLVITDREWLESPPGSSLPGSEPLRALQCALFGIISLESP